MYTITANSIIDNVRASVASRIACDDNPLFIWGTGALGKHAYNYCQINNIKLEGWFVNVPTNLQENIGLPVYSLEELLDKYPTFSVLIGHADYANGIEYLNNLQGCEHIYYLTSLCYGIYDNITTAFLNDYTNVLNCIYSECADELSRDAFLSYLKARCNDMSEYMFPYYHKGTNYFNNDVIKLSSNETLLDVGACVGAAIWQFIDAVESKYSQIIAFEPDENNYAILNNEVAKRNVSDIIVKNQCIYNRDGKVRFFNGGEAGGIIPTSKDYTEMDAVTIDSLSSSLNVDISIIKINFPYSVQEVLLSASELIKNKKPKLIIRIGFDPNIIADTYTTIKRLNPAYRYYFRYTIGVPQGLTLFAV